MAKGMALAVALLQLFGLGHWAQVLASVVATWSVVEAAPVGAEVPCPDTKLVDGVRRYTVRVTVVKEG